MAVTQVSICNSALVKVGADRISSITQEVRRAQLLNAIWDQIVDSVIRARKWNFARKRVTLSPTGNEPEWGYAYEYDLPGDYLGHPEVDPDDIEFVVENGKILTDESELEFIYNYRNTDPSSWDSSFAEALAWRLASEIAYALTQSNTLAANCEVKYQRALGEAGSMDSMEGTPQHFRAETWTRARRGR